MKKKLSLQTLLNLMEYLEKQISLTKTFVLANNAALKSKKDNKIEEKVREQYEKRQKCQKQLRVFKLAKTTANMTEVEGVTNNERIFELSDLKRDERFLSSLLEQKKGRKGSKGNVYIHYIPKDVLENELREIEEQISELKNQMSEFNESFEVEVEIDKDLDLI